TVFGWQKPCYLLNEGYAPSFEALMAETEWTAYGTGNYEKCADCMFHSGYEPTAIADSVRPPLEALKVALMGPDTEGEMAPEIPLEKARRAVYVFEGQVDAFVSELDQGEAGGVERSDAA
ncbi:MAG: DUF3463 domain-containing protein, partial [Alphaproteobacteria bacterium]|nr:DUF3463 domain-containing protein [Alphaproteobacteria bacterium]